jgi:hypothetical protein
VRHFGSRESHARPRHQLMLFVFRHCRCRDDGCGGKRHHSGSLLAVFSCFVFIRTDTELASVSFVCQESVCASFHVDNLRCYVLCARVNSSHVQIYIAR